MKKYFSIAFCLFGLHGNSQQLFTLPEAINTALKNSFDIQIAKNNLTISTLSNDKGFAGALPVVNATINDVENSTSVNQKLNNGNTVNRGGARANNLTGNVQGTFLLYNGYRVVATKQRLEQIQKISEQQLNSQIQNTLAAVATKYYDIVRQESYYQTLTVSLDLSLKRLQIINARRDAGLANMADVYQGELDLNARKQELQTQQLVIDQAKTDLLVLMRLPTNLKISIKDSIVVDKSLQLDSLQKKLYNNPDIQSAALSVKVNEFVEKETAAQRYPSVRLNAGLNYNRNQSEAGLFLLNQSYGPFVGLNIQVPIYNGNTLKKQQQIAKINTKNAGLQQKELTNNLEANLMRAYQSYTNTFERIDIEQRNFEIAKQLNSLVFEKFKLNQATILELREAQKSFEDTGYRLINLAYAAKIAEIELKRSAAILTF